MEKGMQNYSLLVVFFLWETNLSKLEMMYHVQSLVKK